MRAVSMPIGNESHARRDAALRFAVFVGALVVGCMATVTPAAATWFGRRGPQCPLGACCGQPWCPGCGLVRSTASALQGDLGQAVAVHAAGPVIAFLLLAGSLLNLDIVRRAHETAAHRSWRRRGRLTFVIAIALGWGWRLAHR